MKMKRRGKLEIKFLLGLFLLGVAISGALVFVITSKYRANMEEYYTKLAFDQANIVAASIDGDRIAEYVQTLTRDSYYEEIHQMLVRTKETMGLKYLYVVIPYPERMLYIWDAGGVNAEDGDDLGDTGVYYDNGEEVMREAFLHPSNEREALITRSETYGYLVSAYAVILDSAGKPAGQVVIDLSMDQIDRQIQDFSNTIILIAVGVLLPFILAYFLMIRFTILVPVERLNKAASTIVSEQMEALADFHVSVKTGDELEALALSFNRMAHDLYHYIQDLSVVTAEKERIGVELGIASEIQMSMLPLFPTIPDQSGIDIFGIMTPAKEVGGDFFDYFFIDEDRVCVVVADVSGKGVPAALFMVISKTLIKDNVLSGKEPSEVFKKVNEQLCESNDASMFVTAFMGVLTLSTGNFTFVNAGHNPPLIRRSGTFEWLEAKVGFVLAGLEDTVYMQAETTLQKGDAIFLYTDGVTEAMDTKQNLYSDPRLLGILNDRSSTISSAKDMATIVADDVTTFAQGVQQADDITILSLVYSGGQE
ncbi:hypothetical protein FACS1894111_06550 [Clostridia bacterium]|nr:hypothetical protein FACS1894111_06550 [Clostridia bacterium]